MASTFQIFLLLFFITALIAVIFNLGVAGMYRVSQSSRTTTHGMTGFAGDTITIGCPKGKKISVATATIVCNDMNSNQQLTCDPNTSTGSFNPSTTTDLKDVLSKSLNDKETTSFTIPTLSPSLCGGVCKQMALIGTYDCVVD